MRWLIICLLVTGCSVNPFALSKQDKFRFQACATVYCESTENSVIKNTSLLIVNLYGIGVGRGFCSEYYDKRALGNGYIYALKSAEDFCNAVELE